MCACGGQSNQDKNNKAAECNRIYREAIGSVDSIKANLFTQTTDNTITFFVNDAHQVKTICR
jgi:hypothetical protein